MASVRESSNTEEIVRKLEEDLDLIDIVYYSIDLQCNFTGFSSDEALGIILEKETDL